MPTTPPTALPPRIVGILPAAGYAARLRLAGLTGSKELVEVDGRSTLEHAVARLRRGGATEIRVVTRPEKTDVVARATSLGARVLEGRPPTAAASVALGLDGLHGGDVVLVDFPDMVWEPEDGFVPVVAAVLDGADVALGCFDSDEPERGDVVELAGGRVVGLQVKPAYPRTNLVWGCAATRAGALEGLDRHDHVGDLFVARLADLRVVGLHLGHRLLDIGTPEALAEVRAPRPPGGGAA